jgi:DNA replication licensing factor MCM6
MLSWLMQKISFSSFEVDGEVKYLEKAKELVKPERNTLQVSFQDVEKYNSNLAVTIVAEYYRYCSFFLL